MSFFDKRVCICIIVSCSTCVARQGGFPAVAVAVAFAVAVAVADAVAVVVAVAVAVVRVETFLKGFMISPF
jgi:hypothetical protein